MKPKKVLCKRTLTLGEDSYYPDWGLSRKLFKVDNRVITEGQWYDVVYNEHDTERTFSIIDNKGEINLFFMYDTDDENLPRAYTKWFYTQQQIREKKIDEILDYD